MAVINKPSDINKIWAVGGDKVSPSDVKISTGWEVEVPPRQYFNWLDNKQDQFNAHVNQHGIAVWDATTEYLAGKSYTQGSDGEVYKAVIASGPATVVQDPTTDTSNTYWEVFFSDATRVDVASAATVNLNTLAGDTRGIRVTGTTTITGFTVKVDRTYSVTFAGVLTLTNNASIVTQSGANITTAAGDTCWIRATAANVVEVMSYVSASMSGRKVQSSAVDQTAGSLMAVGAGGLLGDAPLLVTNANSVPTGGSMCVLNTPFTNGPTANFHTLYSEINSSGAGSQLAVPYASGDTIYTRTRAAGVWSGWTAQYGQGNLVGTVSGTPGAPTGAAMEVTTQNLNVICRFANGIQIVSGFVTTPDDTITSAWMGDFISTNTPGTNWSTKPFLSAPLVVGIPFNNTATGVILNSKSTTGADFKWVAGASQASGIPRTLNFIAVGQWAV